MGWIRRRRQEHRDHTETKILKMSVSMRALSKWRCRDLLRKIKTAPFHSHHTWEPQLKRTLLLERIQEEPVLSLEALLQLHLQRFQRRQKWLTQRGPLLKTKLLINLITLRMINLLTCRRLLVCNRIMKMMILSPMQARFQGPLWTWQPPQSNTMTTWLLFLRSQATQMQP